MRKILPVMTFIVFMGFLSVASAQMPMAGKPWHKDISQKCFTCHEDKKPTGPSANFKCANCHGTPEGMAKKTELLGRMNPHVSPHFETALPCNECHKEHQTPYNYCTESCHRNWPNTIPGK